MALLVTEGFADLLHIGNQVTGASKLRHSVQTTTFLSLKYLKHLRISEIIRVIIYCVLVHNQSRPHIFDLEVKCPEVLYDSVVEVEEEVAYTKYMDDR